MGRVPRLDDLDDVLQGLQKRIRRLETGTPLRNASIGRGAVRFSDNGIILGKDATIQSEDFDGNLTKREAGTKGWAISRQLAAFADLVLRPGSVGNDLLTNPVLVEAIYDSRTNFALTTTMANIRTKTIPVPDGFTKAAVSIVVRVFALNPNTTAGYDSAGGDYLYGQANINGYNGFALPLAVSGNGGSGTNNSPFSAVLTGLAPSSSISLQIAAQTAFANWAANVQNVAEISGSVQWFR